jgi:hypothetical protein
MRQLLIVVLGLCVLPGGAAADEISAGFARASDETFSRPHDLVLSPDGRRL